MPPPPTADPAPVITVTGDLDKPTAAEVLRLATAATDADAVGPLSEHVMLHVRYGGQPQARNLVLTRDGAVAGYAYLDPAGPGEGPSGELVIHPGFRRHGLGLMLTRALVAEAAPQPVRVWAHGDLPAATALARRAGFERLRALWTMRRSLREPPDEPRYAGGITVRTFTVGRDEAAWVDVNRRAFAGHPEQGAWTMDDVTLREREPWFDPAGFFLAERSGTLAGFHWTKIHSSRPGGHGDGHSPIGEVYVVGVDPAEQGTGLGRALTLEGLRYLHSRGLPDVMLYVDEENTAAVRLYESLGFQHWGTDVMFRHPGSN